MIPLLVVCVMPRQRALMAELRTAISIAGHTVAGAAHDACIARCVGNHNSIVLSNKNHSIVDVVPPPPFFSCRLEERCYDQNFTGKPRHDGQVSILQL